MNNKLNLDKQGEEQGLFNDIFKFISRDPLDLIAEFLYGKQE